MIEPVSKVAIAYWDFENGAHFWGPERGWLKRNPKIETDFKFVKNADENPFKEIEKPKGKVIFRHKLHTF